MKYDFFWPSTLLSTHLFVAPHRYGAPRRNAQERLRSVIMRDERCAETIQRLLDDLHGLLQSRTAGDRDGNLAENVEEKVWGGAWKNGAGGNTSRMELKLARPGHLPSQLLAVMFGKLRAHLSQNVALNIPHSTSSPHADVCLACPTLPRAPSQNRNGQNQGPAWGGGSRAAGGRGGRRDGESELAATSSAHISPDDDRSLTQLLRSNLLSLRAAFFRHASFLEFLPAPERVDQSRVVPGGDLEGAASGAPEDQEEGDGEVGEVLDPEVRVCLRCQAGWKNRGGLCPVFLGEITYVWRAVYPIWLTNTRAC